MDIVIRIVPGQKAWQHARVGRVHFATDHRQAHSGHGVHAKLLEYGDMAMPAANEDQIFDNGRLLSLHTCLSKVAVSMLVSGDSSMCPVVLPGKGHTLFLPPVMGKLQRGSEVARYCIR